MDGSSLGLEDMLQHYNSWQSLSATSYFASVKPVVIISHQLCRLYVYATGVHHIMPNLNLSVQLHNRMVDCRM